MQHVQLNDYRKYDTPRYRYENNVISIMTTYDDANVKNLKSVFYSYGICAPLYIPYEYFYDGENCLASKSETWTFHDENVLDFFKDNIDTPFYIWRYTMNVNTMLCVYCNINANIIMVTNVDQSTRITMMDYEDPYADDEVYEGTIQNVLDFPRVISHNNETYIRVTLFGRQTCTIIATHNFLCYVYKPEN